MVSTKDFAQLAALVYKKTDVNTLPSLNGWSEVLYVPLQTSGFSAGKCRVALDARNNGLPRVAFQFHIHLLVTSSIADPRHHPRIPRKAPVRPGPVQQHDQPVAKADQEVHVRKQPEQPREVA